MPDAIRDEVLVERARAGDQPAFLLLYERYRNEVFRFLYLLSGSIEVAEDITHDCFLSLITGLREVQADTSASLRTQLYSTARNVAMEYFGDSGHKAYEVPVYRRERRSGEVSTVEVSEAVLGLPLLEREVLVFSEYEGLTPNHIASIVGSDVETVTARLERARQCLRNTLAVK